MARADLSRPHPWASERVGFLFARAGDGGPGRPIVVGTDWLTMPDGDYDEDPRVGAMLSHAGFRRAMQATISRSLSAWHVHQHDHFGPPLFSRLDLRENQNFVPDFFNVQPGFPHGALVLSRDAIAGLSWARAGVPPVPPRIRIVGATITFVGEGP